MKFDIKAKSKKHEKYAKLIEQVMNTNHEYTFMGEISSDISLKLMTWEMFIGKEMLIEILNTYTKETN